MNSILISNHRYTLALAEDTELRDCIVEAVAIGWRNALEMSNPSRPPHDVSVQMYANVTENLTKGLWTLGFARKVRESQVRYESTGQRYGFKARLMACRGRRVNDSCFAVNRKGMYSREAIAQNGCCEPQGALFAAEELGGDSHDIGDFHNYWIVWQPARRGSDELRAYLCLPVEVNRSGNRMRCADVIPLYDGLAYDIVARRVELPVGPTVVPTLEVKDNEDGEE